MIQGPLSGVKVVELTTYVAAPACGRILADWGAEVIKVEPPSGDVWRSAGSRQLSTVSTEEENPCFDIVNANKQSIALNLKTPEGMEVLHRLLATADVFLTNTRDIALRRLGLDYDSLRAHYPRLIGAVITGYGDEGPEAESPGFDLAAFWARSGCLVDMVAPGDSPIWPTMAFGDMIAGTSLFGGICGALYQREKTGRGDRVSVSLYGTALWIAGYGVITTQEKAGYRNAYPQARELRAALNIPYLCRDGERFLMTVLAFEQQYRAVYEALELPELIADPHFNTLQALAEHGPELVRLLDLQFQKKNSTEWYERFRARDLVCAIVRHFRDVPEDEQAWANHYLHEMIFDSGNRAAMPRPNVRLDSAGIPLCRRGPLPGEDTETILRRLGYSREDISTLPEHGTAKI